MTETDELHARLLADARNYDPNAHNRGLLAPYRDVLLLWRAKFTSYEQIAATLTKHGIKVSPAGVGVFCRRSFTKAELEHARQGYLKSSPSPAATPRLSAPRNAEPAGSRRGPKVARDDY